MLPDYSFRLLNMRHPFKSIVPSSSSAVAILAAHTSSTSVHISTSNIISFSGKVVFRYSSSTFLSSCRFSYVLQPVKKDDQQNYFKFIFHLIFHFLSTHCRKIIDIKADRTQITAKLFNKINLRLSASSVLSAFFLHDLRI